jgi:nicotinamidase/pyrazinamidase
VKTILKIKNEIIIKYLTTVPIIYFNMMFDNSALVIVDVQNDFCKGGSLEVPGANTIIPIINSLKQLPFNITIFTKDWHPKNHCSFQTNNAGSKLFEEIVIRGTGKQIMWPIHCVQDTHGANIHRELQLNKYDKIIKKGCLSCVDSYSAFGDNGFGELRESTGLGKLLFDHKIKKLYIVGLALDYCVYYTAKDSILYGLETYVIQNATRGVSSKTSINAVRNMEKKGVHFINSVDLFV